MGMEEYWSTSGWPSQVEHFEGADRRPGLQGQHAEDHQDHLRVCLHDLRWYNWIPKDSASIKNCFIITEWNIADLPRGPIKNNSMRKLAAKTLMEILPPEIEQMVSYCNFCHYLFCHYLFLSLSFFVIVFFCHCLLLSLYFLSLTFLSLSFCHYLFVIIFFLSLSFFH